MKIDNLDTYRLAWNFEPVGEPRVTPDGYTVQMVSNGSGLFGVVVGDKDPTKLLLVTDSPEYSNEQFEALSVREG